MPKAIHAKLSALSRVRLAHIIMMIYATASPKLKRRIIRLIGLRKTIKRRAKHRKAKHSRRGKIAKGSKRYKQLMRNLRKARAARR